MALESERPQRKRKSMDSEDEPNATVKLVRLKCNEIQCIVMAANSSFSSLVIQNLYEDSYGSSDKERSAAEEIDRLLTLENNTLEEIWPNPPNWPDFGDRLLNYDHLQGVEFCRQKFYIFYINSGGVVRFVGITFHYITLQFDANLYFCSIGQVISASFSRCSIRIKLVQRSRDGTWKHKHEQEFVKAETIVGGCKTVPFDLQTCEQVRNYVAQEHWAGWAERIELKHQIDLTVIQAVDGGDKNYEKL